MTELKTLKDITDFIDVNGKQTCGCMGCSESCECDIKPIKQEAIKWVKSFTEPEQESAFLAFRDFFNITEEELK